VKPNPHPIPSSVRRSFLDVFNRPNRSDIGNATDGSFWKKLRGIFRVFEFKAEAVSDPEDYPMVTQNMPFQDVDLSLFEIDNGSSAALWVTDAGNWYSVGIDQHPIDCNCDTDTSCVRWNASTITGWTTVETGGRNRFSFISSYTCTGGNSFTIPGNSFFQRGNSFFVSGNSFTTVSPVYATVTNSFCRRFIFGGRCVEWGTRTNTIISRWNVSTGWNSGSTQWNSGNTEFNSSTTAFNALDCNANFATGYNAPNFSSFINGYNAETCAQYTEFTVNCETCYPQYIRILQSVGNTVSTLFSKMLSPEIYTVTSPFGNLTLFKQDNPLTQFVRSMKIFTRNDEITTELYSDQDLQDKIEIDNEGQIVYTPTNAEVTPEYGIMIKPSEYNQQNFIGGILINPPLDE